MTKSHPGRQLQLGEHLALGLWCYLGVTQEQAKRAPQPIFEEQSKFAAKGWQMPV